MKAIYDEEVFGFVKCDVTSSQEMIDRHLNNGFLFPPVITRQTITNDMLSPFMTRILEENPKADKIPSPVQTYHGKNLFLLSSLVKLYMDLGLAITNITEFVQYVPGKGLLPFTRKLIMQ